MPSTFVSKQLSKSLKTNNMKTNTITHLFRTVLTVFLISLYSTSYSQKVEKTNSDSYHKNIYVNLLGADLLAGIHYDMRLLKGRQDGPGFSAGIGGGAGLVFFTSTTVRMIPVEFNYVIGSKSNGIVLGAGFALMDYNSEIIFKSDSKTSSSATSVMLHAAYRYQPKDYGLFFQAGLQITSFEDNLPSPIPLSIGIGYGFK